MVKRPDFHITAPLWVRIFYVSPFAVLAVAVAFQMTLPAGMVAVLMLALAGLILWGTPGKYPALFVGLILWLVLITVLADFVGAVVPLWIGGILALVLTVFAVLAAVRIGAPWGYARAQRLAQAGRPVRGWEWVHTGAEFALTHPLAKLSGGLLVMIGFVLVQWLVWLISLIWVQGGWIGWAVFGLLTVLSLLTLYALVCRKPGARPLVWMHLVLWFPVSLPLMVYWADGTRPNLVYARRFERLVPLGPYTAGAER